MQLLILTWEYPPHVIGGLGRHVAELIPALVEQQVNVHVVTPVVNEEETSHAVEQGVTVHRVYSPILNTDQDFYKKVYKTNQLLTDYITRFDQHYDLIHLHDWLVSFTGLALQQIWDRPLLATIHATERGRGRGHIGNDLQRLIDDAERQLIQEANHLIVCSHYMADELQSFFHTPPARLDVVPNGVNLTELEISDSEAELAEFRRKYAEPDDLIVFSVTRLVHEKGLHRLVEAAPTILESCSRARIIIAGKGPEADNLKRQVDHLGISSRVNFVGFISDEDRNRFYTVATCAVFPSLYEPFGIVALEAMALCCPVVVSDVGGLGEIVTHGENGITIYPDDAESVAWGVLRILNYPEIGKRCAARAYQHVEQLYNWSRIARLTRAVYRRTLS